MSGRFASAAGWAGYGVALWLGLLVMPAAVPLATLDRSWFAMLGHDWQAGLRAGEESVFTYGPLGWLLTPSAGFDSDLYATKLAAMLIAMLAAAAVLTAFVRRLPTAAGRILGALLLLCLAPVVAENLYLAVILAGTAIVLDREISLARALPVCVLLAVAGLIKFTNLPPALAGVVAMVLVAWRQRSHATATAVAAAWLAATAIAWVAAGQELTGIGTWLARSVQIAVGYQDVMGTPGSGLQAAIGGGCVVVMACLCAAAGLARPRGFAPVVQAGFVMVAVLVAWKAGFVRQDQGHARLFFGVVALAPLALPQRAASPSGQWWLRGTMAVLVLAIVGIEAGRTPGEPGVLDTATAAWDRASRNMSALAAPAQFATEQDAAWRAFAAETALEETRRASGKGGIDAFGHEQGILLANGLRVVHRPVFQSYSAYTQELQELNAGFWESARAPDHVLFKLQPVDGYFPTVADSQALLVLLSSYAPELVERGFLLLKRRPEPKRRADVPMPVVFAGRVALGDWVGLAGLPGELHLLELDLAYSLLGRLQGLLLRPPRLRLEVKLDDGRQIGFRIAPAIARAPFLVDPLVQTTPAFLALYGGAVLPRVTAFRVVGKGGRGLGLADGLGVRVLAADGLRSAAAATPEQFERLDRGFYPMFHAWPFQVIAPVAPEAVLIGATEVLMAPAPSELRFRLGPGRHVVSGGFGIRDGVWRDGFGTDGVAFRILELTGTQEREVFQRLLQPGEREADRGIQKFRVDVDGAEAAVLVLSAEPGPNRDPRMEWSYWTDIRIEPR